MVGIALKEIQEEFNKTITSTIESRYQSSEKALKGVRESLFQYFFDTVRTSELFERPKEGEEVFNFSLFQPFLEKCLTDEPSLSEIASSLTCNSEVSALDYQIRESGLSFEWDSGCYVFKSPITYTAKAREYLMQFAKGISIYRTALGIFECYKTIREYASLAEYTDLVQLLHQLEEEMSKPDSQESLKNLFLRAKQIKKLIKNLCPQINTFSLDFQLENDTHSKKSELETWYNGALVLLPQSYLEFPNPAKFIWVLSDGPWQELLKRISGILFCDKYTFSRYSGTLTIYQDFVDVVISEISLYYEKIAAKLPDFKLKLLKELLDGINHCITNIRLDAGYKGIELIEAPTGLFMPRDPIYRYLTAMVNQRSLESFPSSFT